MFIFIILLIVFAVLAPELTIFLCGIVIVAGVYSLIDSRKKEKSCISDKEVLDDEIRKTIKDDQIIDLTKISTLINDKLSKNEFILTKANFDASYVMKENLDKYECKGKLEPNKKYETIDKQYSAFSLLYVDKYCIKNNLNNYSFVDISRSSVLDIPVGKYIYVIDQNSNLNLLKLPFEYEGENYYLNLSGELSTYLIKKSHIKDFQYYGNQVSSIEIKSHMNRVKAETMVSEILFGPSYTILKGLSKFQISSTTKIEDLRNVQLIFHDKTDIEFKGISIYYDLNRHLGLAHNNEASVLGYYGKDTKNIENHNVNGIRENSITSTKCPKCGSLVSKDAKFCMKCGTPIEKIKCSNCGSELESGSSFCSRCGARVNNF